MSPGKRLHKVIIPKSDLLKKHIYSFNILNEFPGNSGVQYTAFPQKGITVGVFKNGQLSHQEKQITISTRSNSSSKVICLGKFLHPIHVRYKKHVQKISIHFKELSVNHFFPDYFNTVGENWIYNTGTSEFGIDDTKLFEQSESLGLEYLEDYLLKKYSLVDLGIMKKVLKRIKKDPGITNAELCSIFEVAEKTLNRQSKKFLGCRLVEYKRLARFRGVIESYYGDNLEEFMDLCYDNGYYDPSHFNKSINEKTGYNPKRFFKDLKKMGLDNHIYIFR